MEATFMISMLDEPVCFEDVIKSQGVTKAFLNGNGYLEEEIFMRQSKGFIKKEFEDKVRFLQRSPYGLKHSSRAWFSKINISHALISSKDTSSSAQSALKYKAWHDA